ncbi:hypothetical protein HYD81_00830 [Mycoplasmopsis bovis]|nr:hypothetical protein [Mycoplasmopsis bovis]QQH42507.1 hypothetical protein HYD81_00830 [Mycoplasmopsis bovis]
MRWRNKIEHKENEKEQTNVKKEKGTKIELSTVIIKFETQRKLKTIREQEKRTLKKKTKYRKLKLL